MNDIQFGSAVLVDTAIHHCVYIYGSKANCIVF